MKTWLVFPKGLVVGWGMVMGFGFDLMLLLLKPSGSKGFFGGRTEELSQPVSSLFQEIFIFFFLKKNNAQSTPKSLNIDGILVSPPWEQNMFLNK